MSGSSNVEKVLKEFKELLVQQSTDDPLSELSDDEEQERNTRAIHFIEGIQLEKLMKLYEQGNPGVLLSIIAQCLRAKIEVPEPFANAFTQAIGKWQNSKVATLDEAFNVTPPKGRKKAYHKQKIRLMFHVHNLSTKLHDEEHIPIDEGLFEQVGKKFNLSAALAKKYYYLTETLVAADSMLTAVVLKDLFFRLREDDD